jgi:uncharacterized protein (DUF1810 family)
MDDDPYDLHRFVAAQDPVYEQVTRELSSGTKTSHWIWFIFPQLKGLGRSSRAELFGLANAAEARAFWNHPVLGRRLEQCVGMVLGVEGRSALQIFGFPDDVKFRSSMTLFEVAVPESPLFARALDAYFDGERDERTLSLL